MLKFVCLGVSSFFVAIIAAAASPTLKSVDALRVAIKRSPTGIQILSASPTDQSAERVTAQVSSFARLNAVDQTSAQRVLCGPESCQTKLLRSIPYFLREDQAPSPELYEEYIVDGAQKSRLLNRFLRSASERFNPNDLAFSEMRVIREQGPKENRINLTILGDGYTNSEKDRFFADCERITAELFDGHTFASYLPLFNVYAVFVPSRESGIGDGRPKNTAFRLYRDPAGSKRAIMPGDESALEAALELAPATDYPIVIANDEFYGGLGGRYAISTRSVESGMIVLRHELGHNFGEVGEEYDNGMVYAGANSASSTRVGWAHWSDGPVKVNEAAQLTGDYVWQNLANGPYRKSFQVRRGPQGFVYGRISSVGWASPEDVKAFVDGRELPLEGKFTVDRSFFNMMPSSEWSVGNHSIEFRDNNRDGDNVLAFATLFEVPSDYDFTPKKIGAYATFNQFGMKSYRPTHDDCLMREMTIDYFCAVDQENMWLKFLNRVRLIDDVQVAANAVSVVTPPLVGLSFRWLKRVNGQWVELPSDQQNRSSLTGLSAGNYRVEVSFETPEVRRPNANFREAREFNL